jgi:hypothetical protein
MADLDLSVCHGSDLDLDRGCISKNESVKSKLNGVITFTLFIYL